MKLSEAVYPRDSRGMCVDAAKCSGQVFFEVRTKKMSVLKKVEDAGRNGSNFDDINKTSALHFSTMEVVSACMMAYMDCQDRSKGYLGRTALFLVHAARSQRNWSPWDELRLKLGATLGLRISARQEARGLGRMTSGRLESTRTKQWTSVDSSGYRRNERSGRAS